jgi:hypothetical protein
MKQTTAQINRIVAKAYDALQVLDNMSMKAYRRQCFDMALQEERDHRKGAPDGRKWPKGATPHAAARLFVVKRIAEALIATDASKATVADFINWQGSAFYAASLVANFRAEILRVLDGQDIAALADLGYVAFTNNGETP